MRPSGSWRIGVTSFLSAGAHSYLMARLGAFTCSRLVSVEDYGHCDEFVSRPPAGAAIPRALFVGGGEPRGELEIARATTIARVADWCDKVGVPRVIYSCLAAQLYLRGRFGVPASRRPEKLFGVFAHSGGESDFFFAQSRWNLVEWSGKSDGYEARYPCALGGEPLLWSAGDGGPILLQGHPEYATDMLLREYRRDLRRKMEIVPRPPVVPPLLGGVDVYAKQNLAAVDAELERSARFLIDTVLLAF